jgi:hypothetical protein
MGVFIKNADKTIKNSHETFSYLQTQLLGVLGEIWNNQDNLNEEDKKLLIKISQKGLYENLNEKIKIK